MSWAAKFFNITSHWMWITPELIVDIYFLYSGFLTTGSEFVSLGAVPR